MNESIFEIVNGTEDVYSILNLMKGINGYKIKTRHYESQKITITVNHVYLFGYQNH